MENTRDQARLLFKEKGLSYSNIKKEEIALLQKLLKEELSIFENNDFVMKLSDLRKKDIGYKEDGTLKYCLLRVKGITKGSADGYYKDIVQFKDREAISFNSQNANEEFFIGFSGWADSKNVQPILNAFNKFTLLFNS
jgi:hypothetical protein